MSNEIRSEAEQLDELRPEAPPDSTQTSPDTDPTATESRTNARPDLGSWYEQLREGFKEANDLMNPINAIEAFVRGLGNLFQDNPATDTATTDQPKFQVEIRNSQGIVIGDHNEQTNRFHDR